MMGRFHPDAERVLRKAIELQNEAIGKRLWTETYSYDKVSPWFVFLAILKMEGGSEAGKLLLRRKPSTILRFVFDKHMRFKEPNISFVKTSEMFSRAAALAKGRLITSVDLLVAAAEVDGMVYSVLHSMFGIDKIKLERIFKQWEMERGHLFGDVVEEDSEPMFEVLSDDDEELFDDEESFDEHREEMDYRSRRNIPFKRGSHRKKDTLEDALKFIKGFGRDLTVEAKEGKLEPLIGRKKEVLELIEILGRRIKSNPLIIGNPGVGKTMIVHGLAARIAYGEVPEYLKDAHIIELSTSAIVAGTKYRGEFEDRLKKIIDLAVKYRNNIILFFDEIHTLIGAGSAEGALDAANILKPALATGQLRVIGATTYDDYKKRFEKDSALVRRFVPVYIDEPSIEETKEILLGTMHLYESHYKISIPPELLDPIVKLSKRYISSRYLPDKAVDVLDRACGRAALEYMNLKDTTLMLLKVTGKEDSAFAKGLYWLYNEKHLEKNDLIYKLKYKGDATLRMDHILEVISDMSGVPVSRISDDEMKMLRNLEKLLKERVIGQDAAVKKVAKAVRRGRLGIRNQNRPVAVFLFMGPTGVGKTELARALASVVYGSEDNMIRLDMSEYMEQHSVSKLFGSPPGYVGYGEGGQLTEAVRKKPYSLILLDEVEKAHPRVWDTFLQVFEDGFMTDGQGRRVDFRNTIIIMTSNVGAERLKEARLGFVGDKSKEINEILSSELKRTFRPEFLNRVDSVVFFRPLDKKDMREILYVTISKYKNALDEKGIRFRLTKRMEDLLLEKGFDPEYGARPIRRALDEYLFNPIVDYYLEHGEDAVAGKELVIDWDPDKREVFINVYSDDLSGNDARVDGKQEMVGKKA